MAWTCTLRELAAAVGADPPPHDIPFSRVSTDTRSLLPGDLFLALRGEQYDANAFLETAFERGAAAVVAERPTTHGPCVVVDDTLAALQRFAAWHRARFDIPVLAITGSCGKTTAKDLTAALLATRYTVARTAGNLNNEIGCPQSLLQMDGATQFAVLEMGANHAGEIARLCELARPTESAITLVAPAHLEGFGDIAAVAAAKAEIVEALPAGGCFYVNSDNAWCREIAERHAGEKVYFGATGDVALEGIERLPDGGLQLDIAPVGRLRLPLPVRAHASNVLLAIAVALRHGIDVGGQVDALREACAVLTRFRVLDIGPLRVLDDSYNANPASMDAALEALAEQPGDGARIAVLGEMLELGEAAEALHADLGRAAARHGVGRLYVRGPHAETMARAARDAGVPHAEAVEEHEAIARDIAAHARPGAVVLVKGSRGMRMENVVGGLRALLEK